MIFSYLRFWVLTYWLAVWFSWCEGDRYDGWQLTVDVHTRRRVGYIYKSWQEPVAFLDLDLKLFSSIICLTEIELVSIQYFYLPLIFTSYNTLSGPCGLYEYVRREVSFWVQYTNHAGFLSCFLGDSEWLNWPNESYKHVGELQEGRKLGAKEHELSFFSSTTNKIPRYESSIYLHQNPSLLVGWSYGATLSLVIFLCFSCELGDMWSGFTDIYLRQTQGKEGIEGFIFRYYPWVQRLPP